MEKNDLLSIFTHDLFTNSIDRDWRSNLVGQSQNRWFSLIVELEKTNGSVDRLKNFGEDIYSKLVYRCIPSPKYRKTGEIMLLFNVSDLLWTSVIFFEPKTPKVQN